MKCTLENERRTVSTKNAILLVNLVSQNTFALTAVALTEMTLVVSVDFKTMVWPLLLITRTFLPIHMSATLDTTRLSTQIHNFLSPIKGENNVIISPDR